MFIGLCLKQLLDNHHTFSHYCLCTQKELCQSNTCCINEIMLYLIATILKALTILIKIKEQNIIFFNCSHAACKISENNGFWFSQVSSLRNISH